MGLWESDDALPRGDGLDEVTCTANGAHLPAKGTQPGWQAGNGPADRADGERAHLPHLLICLLKRERDQACKQDFVQAILGVGF